MVSAATLTGPISARAPKAMPQVASHHDVLVRTQLQASWSEAMVLSTNLSIHPKALSISTVSFCSFY